MDLGHNNHAPNCWPISWDCVQVFEHGMHQPEISADFCSGLSSVSFGKM